MDVDRGTTRRRRGFTILELLIVVSMMGILAAMSLSRSSRIMTSWRVNRAAQALAEEYQLGFALVGRNRKPVVMEFRTDSMNLTIRSRPDVSGNTTVFHVRHFGLSSEFKMSASNFAFSLDPTNPTTHALEIYPPGLAADSLSITMTRNSISKRVRLLRGGLVQICNTASTTSC